MARMWMRGCGLACQGSRRGLVGEDRYGWDGVGNDVRWCRWEGVIYCRKSPKRRLTLLLPTHYASRVVILGASMGAFGASYGIAILRLEL